MNVDLIILRFAKLCRNEVKTADSQTRSRYHKTPKAVFEIKILENPSCQGLAAASC